MLVNLDGASDDAVTVGCAGSDHYVDPACPAARLAVPAEHTVVRLELSGARGGHSGEDIAAGRVNAIKALGQVLEAAFEAAPFGLVSLDGGVSRNAIPRAAQAVVAVADDERIRGAARSELAAIVRQHAGTDDGLVLRSRAGRDATAPPIATETRRSPRPPRRDPDGRGRDEPEPVRRRRDEHLPDRRRTESGRPGALLDGAELERRRPRRPARADGSAGTTRQAPRSTCGARIHPGSRGSTRCSSATAVRRTRRLFGSEPELVVVHGGLECAVLGQKLEGVEMISIGPEIVGLHAPGEKVRISSTERCYRLLGALVDDLSS